MTAIITETVESLDFDFEPQCEHREHKWNLDVHGDGTAYALVSFSHDCGCELERYFCEAFVKNLVLNPDEKIICNGCHRFVSTKFYTILAYL